jgi:Tol biopolymer transport system component
MGTPTPDGSLLTFTAWSRGNLGLRDMESGEIRHLTDEGLEGDGYVEFSVVSPDGERVLYSWYKGWTCELRIVGIDGTGMQTLFRSEDGWAIPYTWSADGRDALVVMGPDTRKGIALVSIEDGSVRHLRELASDSPIEMSFSPDGRFIVYDLEVDAESGQRDIFLLPLDGGRESRIVEDPADDFLLGWVPDSDYILFSSDRSGTPGAWLLEMKDGAPAADPVLVKPDLWRAYPMGFTKDGDLYYGIRVGNRSVRVATLDLDSGELLSQPTELDSRATGAVFWPLWSPDGRHLAYLKENGNARRKTIVVRSMETGETREIRPNLSDISATRWSPDGRRWLVSASHQGHRDRLHLMDVQTGEVETLRVFQGDTVCCNWYRWAPDGESVYYRGSHGNSSWLATLDLETGNERVLYRADHPLFIIIWNEVSPDGRELAFWIGDLVERSGRLLVIPTEASADEREPREVMTFQGAGNTPSFTNVAWTPDGQYLLILGREEENPAIGRMYRIPAAGGELEPLGLARRGLGRLPDLHPDGRTLVFAEGQGHIEIWVMESYLPGR